jgi:rare lipoprotein A
VLIDSNTKKNASEYRRFYRQSVWVPVSLSVLFSACGSLGLQEGPQDGPPGTAINADAIKDIVPKAEPLSKYGNPTSYVAAGKRYYVLKDAAGYVKRGTASWYGKKFHGQRTASGEIYNMYTMSAAHKTLPIPSYVKVTNLNNHKSAIVRVNDRGPFYGNRLIDLSYAAALKLGITGKGTAPVEIRTVTMGSSTTVARAPRSAVSPSLTEQQQTHGLYIQVGAFTARQNAERMQERISSHTSFSVTIREGGSDSAYYRVRIGPFYDNQEVKAATARLSNLGINDTLVLND